MSHTMFYQSEGRATWAVQRATWALPTIAQVQLRHWLQICTKMNGFKFDFSKIFWGGAHIAPSPDPSPAFSRASPSVRASPSILGLFAPSTRASPLILGRFAPSIRASFLTFDWGPWFAPQNKFLDPPLVCGKSLRFETKFGHYYVVGLRVA